MLGSGGPFLVGERVSAGYVVWLDGRARLLVDAGGGTFERLGRLGIDLTSLDAILLTHLHIDHSGGLAPVVFASVMAGHTRLTVLGPAARDDQPGASEVCELLFGPYGAWRYLHTFDGFEMQVTDLPSDADDPVVTTVDLGNFRIETVAVPHGMMPAVGYRISTMSSSITFSGDIEGEHPAFAALAEDTDLLVHALALPERDVPHSHLHAPPSQVGRQARDARCRALLLTHVMPDLEDERPAAERLVRAAYDGPVTWAHDLQTLPVPVTGPLELGDAARG